jgi:RNA polymerase sigma-70 factor (ECF subfamily)
MKPFKDMISPIYEGLYKYIYSIVGNKQMAEDAMQTTLINAYTHISGLRDSQKFKTWIYTIAKHEAFNIIRKYRREVAVDTIENELLDDVEYNTPEEYIIDSELKDAVVEAVNTLNNEERDIINLRYYAELSFSEIAEILDINPNTIKTHHRRIKEKIYKYLLDKEYIKDNHKNENVIKGGKRNESQIG